MTNFAPIALPSGISTLVFLALVAMALAWFVAAHALSLDGQRAKRIRNATVFVVVWCAVTGLLPLVKLAGKDAVFAIQGGVFAAIILFVVSASFFGYGKRIAMGVPIVMLVGFHIIRLPLELVLHQFWEEGFLPRQMTYVGDNFDILTGILAIPAAFVAWKLPNSKWPIWVFNVIGTFLLARVIVIVNLSNPTPLKDAFGGYGDGLEVYAGLFFPYVWLATVVVSIAIFSHIALFRRLIVDWRADLRRKSVVGGANPHANVNS